MPPPRLASTFLIGTIALTLACTETDPSLQLIGGMSVFPAGGDLSQPRFNEPGIQFEQWELLDASLTYDQFDYDLLRGEACTVVDSAISLPFTASTGGNCLNGIVVGSTIGSTGMLTFEANLELRRAEPFDLPDGADLDMDGVLNEDDLCPLIADPDNLDDNGNGTGDACESVVTIGGVSVLVSDQDQDTVSDSFDNCPFVANEDQLDSDDPMDGIGDACTTEVVVVASGTGGSIQVAMPDLEVVIADGQRLFLNLDFNFETALTCDWALGACTLDLSQVEVCALADISSLGC